MISLFDSFAFNEKINEQLVEEEKKDPCIGHKHEKYMTEYNACKKIQDHINSGKTERANTSVPK